MVNEIEYASYNCFKTIYTEIYIIMIRIAKQTDPKKIAELKEKINDKKYINVAIKSIANTLTKEIFHLNEEQVIERKSRVRHR